MTLDEMQNKMMEELKRSYPRSANLFEITQQIISGNNETPPNGPPFARLIEEGYIQGAGDGIGFFKLTAKGKKFIEGGGFGSHPATKGTSSQKRIFPSFKDSSWNDKNKHVNKPLLEMGNSGMDVPLIGYGYDSPEVFDFMQKKDEPNLTVDQVHQLALEQIKTISITVQEYNGQNFKMLICSGNYFAAEKILDPKFMKEAHKKLKSELLAVSLPRKGTMYITNGIMPAEHIAQFAMITQMKYAENEPTPPLSTTIFTVQEGLPAGVINFRNENQAENAAEKKKSFWNKLLGR